MDLNKATAALASGDLESFMDSLDHVRWILCPHGDRLSAYGLDGECQYALDIARDLTVRVHPSTVEELDAAALATQRMTNRLFDLAGVGPDITVPDHIPGDWTTA
jgi:hypothetical protein